MAARALPFELSRLAGLLPLSTAPRRAGDCIVVGFCHAVRRGEHFTALTLESALWLLELDALDALRWLARQGVAEPTVYDVRDTLRAGLGAAAPARSVARAGLARRAPRAAP